jgi:hypothetical protein
VSAIPLADAPALRPSARRTAVVLAVLAAAALACAVALLLGSRKPQTETIVPLPAHADTVVVLDVSASISSDTYSRIGGALAALSRTNGRFGLVVFSDQAYEALPPGAPAKDLAPLVRYFTLPQQTRPGFAVTFPANPWQNTFSGGTRISAGMDLAHQIATTNPRHTNVVLVSDLDDDPGDLERLALVLLSYRRDHIPVRIVGLNPSPQAVSFFQRLLPAGSTVVEAPTTAQAPPRERTPFPWALVALVIAVAAALAAREAWAPRLDWGRA